MNNFNSYLDSDADSPLITSITSPYDQVVQVLTNFNLECWKNNPDCVVVWTLPESVIESFNQIVNYKSVPFENILKEVDEYSSLLLNMSKRIKSILVPTWTFPTSYRGYGILDMKKQFGIANILMHMNLRLSDNLDTASNIYVLNAQKWNEAAGNKAFNSTMWYMGKIPFGNEVFKEAVKDIKAALRGLSGETRKLIIVDLDDTLWGGILGDLGWENINLGGHNHIGEAFRDFQHTLKSLMHRGILLGIVSKNEEAVALDAIRNHSEMVLKVEDFVGWKINWEDKASNIIALAKELKLGLQSVVFIDDSPVERLRVRESLPEVFVPDWPEDKMLSKRMLLSLRCFDTPFISTEDRGRAYMYRTEQKRSDLQKNIRSFDEWLKTLNIKVKIEKLDKSNVQRAAQLLNKTNQMNLSTRRLTEAELLNWTEQDNRELFAFRVSDKFGDSGLTGITSIEIKGNEAQIIDFILSCRVMGRKVEETMVFSAVNYAKFAGAVRIWAHYIPTEKNKPCVEFWKISGFLYIKKDNYFSWDLNTKYSLPESIEIIDDYSW